MGHKPRATPPAAPTFASEHELSAAWNEIGRGYFTEFSARLTRYYGGNDGDVDLDMSDPRPEPMGDQVVRAVIDLNARGRWQQARERFDPAYAPLMGWIQQSNDHLDFVTLLGPDEILVRRGTPWNADGMTFHLRDGQATPVDDVRAVCRSRNRDHLVVARAAGLEVRDARAGMRGLSGPAIATLPWPDMGFGPLAIEQLQVSDDGMRIAVSCYRQGILLASRHRGERPWTLLWPDARPPYGDGSEVDAGDMTHVALSRDGTRLAWGCQDAGHFLAEIEPGSEPRWYATVGHLSEYPHHACFSDDGRHVALNSCHFYNGATVVFDWEGNRGARLDAYEEHPQARCIDRSLRVYAACWLDKPVLDAIVGFDAREPGAFALAGSGVLRVWTPAGGLAAVQGFGSSASSFDYCPETGRLALAAYSGFIHLYDASTEELPGRIDGYRPRREVARWVLWAHLPSGPVCW